MKILIIGGVAGGAPTATRLRRMDEKAEIILLIGESYDETYDKLVISTGAVPIKPPLVGIDSSRILSLRNVPYMDRIKSYVSDNQVNKAVVIGGGFIGLEMVENLHELGIKKEELLDSVTIGGVAAYLDRTENANVNLFI